MYKPKFDSEAERATDPIIVTLGGMRCDTFAPHLPITYLDAAGMEYEGKPDFVMIRPTGNVYIELKDAELNFHRTRESSHQALKDEYRHLFHRCGDHLSHSTLSDALYKHSTRGRLLVLQHGFNHSVFKLAALQAKHGWQRYMVVFRKNPSKKLATRYLSAGLVFCTIKSLRDMLVTIGLIQHGWNVPFVFKTRTYAFSVEGDPATRGRSEEEAEAASRNRYLAAVARDSIAELKQKETELADVAAGMLPF